MIFSKDLQKVLPWGVSRLDRTLDSALRTLRMLTCSGDRVERVDGGPLQWLPCFPRPPWPVLQPEPRTCSSPAPFTLYVVLHWGEGRHERGERWPWHADASMGGTSGWS